MDIEKSSKKGFKAEKTIPLSNMIKGITMGYTLTALVFIIYALLITYTQFSEKYCQTIAMITTVMSVFITGFITAKGVDKKGWLFGMISGLLYAVIMILIGIAISSEFTMNSKTIMIFVLSIAGGGLGGIIGINLKK